MATSPIDRPRRRASRLASASSAYLRSAADQPIDWHPWGDEPFRLARQTGRPVLLDIGAVWCHWCHVMDEGTYVDPEVVRRIEEGFIAVKVDRDEHPEVDRRYQREVNALTGEGGWPLTAFLTADGSAFYGGTYFPPTDGYGRPGFRRVLAEVARQYRDEPDAIASTVRAVKEALDRGVGAPARARVDLSTFADRVGEALDGGYDPVYGGFGGGPKFPHPAALEFWLSDAFVQGDGRVARQLRETLERMAAGGIYDQVGGGFHRYAVDEGWHVPHFEKMAADNAALLAVYAEAAARWPDPNFGEVARGIVDWASRELEDPSGGFGTSQDADNAPGDDGSYYTWSRAELKRELSEEEFRLAVRCFGIDTDGRMPHDPERNVLFRLVSPAEALAGRPTEGSPDARWAALRERLRALRERRRKPLVDRACFASVNGAWIRALARAAPRIGDRSWLLRARRAADRWLADGFSPERGVAHRLAGSGGVGAGHLDDQAEMALGLVELGGVLADRRYVEAGRSLLELIDREFVDETGLARDLAPRLYDGPLVGSIAAPSYPVEDAPNLSANVAVALAWIRWGSLVHDPQGRGRARSLLERIAGRLDGAGLFAGGAAWAARTLAVPPATVVIEGAGADAGAWAARAYASGHPDLWVHTEPVDEPFGLPPGASAAGGGDHPRALVCFERACLPPVERADDLVDVLRRGRPS